MTPSPAVRLVDAALEASVVGSFTRIGYKARRRLFHWTPLSSLRLDGKVAIVTGATSGLGRVTAELLARQGAEVCIVGRNPERTERARGEIEGAAGISVVADLADLSLLSETAAFAARFAASHDRLDILVLNAGALTHEYVVTAEVNYDLDVEAAGAAADLGLVMVRAGTAGTHPAFVAALRELVQERLTPGLPRRAAGDHGPYPDICPPDCCRPGNGRLSPWEQAAPT